MVEPDHAPCEERLKKPAQPQEGQLRGPTAACQGLWVVEKTEPEKVQWVQAKRSGAEAGLMKTFFLTRRPRQWRGVLLPPLEVFGICLDEVTWSDLMADPMSRRSD